MFTEKGVKWSTCLLHEKGGKLGRREGRSGTEKGGKLGRGMLLTTSLFEVRGSPLTIQILYR